MHTIEVYMIDGRVFYYDVESEDKVREHSHRIVMEGYHHNNGKVFEHYPPHMIIKVKSYNISTLYPDQVRGT